MRRGAPVFLRQPRPALWLGTLLVAFLLVQGCEAAPEAKPDLGETAQEYMNLRQQGQWPEIWDQMQDPALRTDKKRSSFMSKRRSVFDIEAFEIISVEQEGTKGEVLVEIDAVIPVLKPGGAILRIPRELTDSQQWIRKDGSWYIQLPG